MTTKIKYHEGKQESIKPDGSLNNDQILSYGKSVF